MTSDREHAIRDAYQAVALAIELLSYLCEDEKSILCVECARSSAERLYKIALAE